MRRDFDLIRLILLDIEEKYTALPNSRKYHFDHPDRDAVADSLRLLVERGLIDAKFRQTWSEHPAELYSRPRLTWEGHDFLDSVRDDEIWTETKEGVKQAGGFSLDLMKALAKGLVKKKIEHHTGVEIDL